MGLYSGGRIYGGASIRDVKESHENAKICYICKEKFENKYLKNKKYRKVRDKCHYTVEYRGAAHSTYNLKYSIPIRRRT